MVKLRKEKNEREFKKKVLQRLDTAKWEIKAKKMRLAAKEVLGKTNGKTKKLGDGTWKYKKQWRRSKKRVGFGSTIDCKKAEKAKV